MLFDCRTTPMGASMTTSTTTSSMAPVTSSTATSRSAAGGSVKRGLNLGMGFGEFGIFGAGVVAGLGWRG